MKIRQIIISGLLFSGLAGLIAKVLLDDLDYYRKLNTPERDVLGYIEDASNQAEQTKAILRQICYVETHQLRDPRSPAQNVNDVLLQEFRPGRMFDTYYTQNMQTLIKNIIVNNHNSEVSDLIAVWFIRKKLDDAFDFSGNRPMMKNMWFFWRSYRTISLTLSEAETYASCHGSSFSCDNVNLSSWRTAFLCVDNDECLDYPTYFATYFGCL